MSCPYIQLGTSPLSCLDLCRAADRLPLSLLFGSRLASVERLSTIVPHPSLNNFFLWNSGTEAIEAAVKVVRKKTGRPHIIVSEYRGRGRTHMQGGDQS